MGTTASKTSSPKYLSHLSKEINVTQAENKKKIIKNSLTKHTNKLDLNFALTCKCEYENIIKENK